MEDTHTPQQSYTLLGRCKPAVRANKRFSKDPEQRQEYDEYRNCLEGYKLEAWRIRTDNQWVMIPNKYALVISVQFYLHRSFMFNSDIDNLLKTVLDALTGVAYGDDRWVISCYQQKIEIPETQEPKVEVCVISIGKVR